MTDQIEIINYTEVPQTDFLREMFEKNRELCFNTAVESIVKENILNHVNNVKLSIEKDKLIKKYTDFEKKLEWERAEADSWKNMNDITSQQVIELQKQISELKDRINELEEQNDKLNDKVKNRDNTIKRISKNSKK